MGDRRSDKPDVQGEDLRPIWEKLPELRESKGWSRARLSHEAFRIDPVGTSHGQINSIEGGRRRASLQTMAALAMALDVDPSVFVEYRLAVARFLLDETQVGLERALKNLQSPELASIEVTYDEIARHSHGSRMAEARDRKHARKTD